MSAQEIIQQLLSLGMTQAAISRETDVSTTTISSIVAGRRDGNRFAADLAALLERKLAHGAETGGDRTNSEPVASVSSRTYARSTIPESLQGTLADIRNGYADGSLGSTSNPSGSNGQSYGGTVGTSRADTRPDGQNDAARTSHDSRTRQVPYPTDRLNGTERNSSSSSRESQRQPIGDSLRASDAKPKGVIGIPLPRLPHAAPRLPGGTPWGEEKPLSADEAKAIRQDLMDGLEAIERGTDTVISNTNKEKAPAVIWQSIDDEDNGFLADQLISMGMRYKPVAWAARGIAHSSRLLRAGMILFPRFWETVQFYADNGGVVVPGGH
jgi:transcriptional regulator with XRE-family HTH domain